MSRTIDWKSVRGLTTAIGLAAVGGFAASSTGVPAGWFTGAMIAVSVAAVGGFNVSMPPRLIEVSTVMIGIMLGAGVTPEVLAGVAQWPASLAILALSVIVCQLGVQTFLMRYAGWSRDTAFFAALPGAMMYALVGAAERGADLRRVAINQIIRVFLLIAILPTVVTVVEVAAPPVARIVASPFDSAVLLVAGIVGAVLFKKLRVPVGMMTGALLASATLHGTGLVHGTFPNIVLTCAFVVLGASVGVRFIGTTVRYILENAVTTVGAFIVAIVISGLFAYSVTLVVDVRLDQLVIAFAPGGVDAMIAVALAMHMDTAFVAAHQIFRLLGVVVFGPLFARLTLGRIGSPPAEDAPAEKGEGVPPSSQLADRAARD